MDMRKAAERFAKVWEESWAWNDVDIVHARFDRPIVDGDRAAVEFRVKAVEKKSGRPLTLTGCAFVRFRPDGLIAEVRDYWLNDEDDLEPLTVSART